MSSIVIVEPNKDLDLEAKKMGSNGLSSPAPEAMIQLGSDGQSAGKNTNLEVKMDYSI